MATLWVRQHNRVCDVLAGRRPAWTDRRVYGVAKNIVQAQMMRIMMNDVLDAGDLRYEPKTFGDRFDGVRGFGTPLELLLTVGLRTGVPDYLRHVKATDNRSVVVPLESDGSQEHSLLEFSRGSVVECDFVAYW
uniref:Prostaglandin G/H synthase 2 n=1 Tax=Sipha flava TaxID=143950 RepID=A0A2S2QSM7_9HEMI